MFFISLIGFLMTNFHATTNNNYTCSHLMNIIGQAINSKNFSEILNLIKEGIDINKAFYDQNYRNVLHFAIRSGADADLIKILIENGANINEKNGYDETPLLLAVEKGDIELVKVLIEKGAEVSKRNRLIITPLHSAAEKGNFELVKVLIENGADVNEKNIYNETPLHLAIDNQNLQMIKILIRMGADIYAESAPGTPSQYAFALSQKTGNSTIYETVLNATKLEMGLPEKYMYCCIK